MTISYPPIDPPKIGSVATNLLTFEEVEERLVEAMVLWFRSPGGGRWPFAGDGPWHLVTKDASAVGQAEHALNAEREGRPAADPPRPLPLSRAEIEERDRVSEWLRFVPDRDRRIVVLGIVQLARGAKRIRWNEIRRALGAEISGHGLGMRYSRAITKIARTLKNGEKPGRWRVNPNGASA